MKPDITTRYRIRYTETRIHEVVVDLEPYALANDEDGEPVPTAFVLGQIMSAPKIGDAGVHVYGGQPIHEIPPKREVVSVIRVEKAP
jgi:hypothetical protein